jgi:tetratricopeptide (TPR) repeat protein
LAKGQFDEAITSGQRAVGFAPLDHYSSFALAVTYFHAQQFDKATEHLRKTVELDPSGSSRPVLAQSYASAGQRERAIEELEMTLALHPKDTFAMLQVAVAYAMLHEAEKARRLLQEVEKNWKPDGHSAFWLASVHALLAEKDTAFEWLERAYQEHSAFLVWLKIMWPHAPLRGDPRFGALVKRIGIPD